MTRWQGRLITVVLGGYASWAFFHHVTQNWQADCVSHDRYLPAKDMVRCTWFTTWPGTVQLVVSALPGVLVALGVVIWSAWSHERVHQSLGGWGPARKSGLILIAGAAVVLVAGFLPWYEVRWKGTSGETFTAANNPPLVSIHHSHASAWTASSHWSIGLLLVAAAAVLGGIAQWRAQPVPLIGRAVLVCCLAIGLAELTAQWWLLVRPVDPGPVRLLSFVGRVPARFEPGYIGRNALTWVTYPGIEKGPTRFAILSTVAAFVVSGWLAVLLLVDRRMDALVS